MRSPLTYFVLLLMAALAAAGYFASLFVRTGFAAMPLIFVVFFLAGAVSVGLDLERFRLTAAGLAIQHLITRHTRIISYPDIAKLERHLERGGRRARNEQHLLVHHAGGVATLRFFERADRDDFERRLEACRQSKLAGNVDIQAELPRAQVVSQSQDWVYPWRRSTRGQ